MLHIHMITSANAQEAHTGPLAIPISWVLIAAVDPS